MKQPQSLAALVAKSLPPIEYLVKDMIARGNLVMMGGRPKSGKSWFSLQMAKAIDTGKPFLDRKTTKAKVLYIALEDGERRIHHRCHLLKWQPENACVLFDIQKFDPVGSKLNPGPGVQEIEKQAQLFDFIVIDTLIATLSARANENDNAAMGSIVNELARIAHETDTAILLVHHTGKGIVTDPFDLLRGASALRGAYDVGFILDRKQGEKEATLHAESRDLDIGNMTIRQAQNGAGWSYEGSGIVLTEIRAGRKVIKAMKEHGDGKTVEELAEILKVSKQAAHSQLTNAEKYKYVYRKSGNDPNSTGKQADLWYLDYFNPEVSTYS